VTLKHFEIPELLLNTDRDGHKAMFGCMLVVVMPRGSTVFLETFGKFERQFQTFKTLWKTLPSAHTHGRGKDFFQGLGPL